MNIMILTRSLSNGGAERVCARLASGLCSTHSVWVVCTHPYENASGAGIYAVDPGVTVINLELSVPSNHNIRSEWIRYIYKCRKRRLLIGEMKRNLGIDLCISFLAEPNFDNVRSRQNEKTIISVRNIYKIPVQKFLLWRAMDRFLMVYAGRRADRVVTVSRNVGIEQAQRYHVQKEKIRTIYNPIDPATVMRNSKKETGDPVFDAFRKDHPFLFISAGRFVKQKGYRHLIRAFRLVAERYPGAGLVLLGEGHLQEKLRETAHANRLDEHVLFPGFHKEPFPYFGKADVFVMTSFYEGFSNAMLEAMACGLPVILTDCNSGPREMCAPDTDSTQHTFSIEQAAYGILTPVCSGNTDLSDKPPEYAESCLADAMCLMISDPEIRQHYSERSLIRARDFSTSRILAEWEALICELFGSAKKVQQ